LAYYFFAGRLSDSGARSLSAQASNRTAHFGGDLFEHAVFGLDRWLRRRQGVYEYSTDPDCLFRINRIAADEYVTLSDGTPIRPGNPILNLHLWNEHLPLQRGGATFGWARRISRAVEASLFELAHCLAQSRELDDISALRADIPIGTTERCEQVARIAAYFGFEMAVGTDADRAPAIRRFGQNFYMFLLVLAANPEALRTEVFLRDHVLVYLPRSSLERRYGSYGIRPVGSAKRQ
jgi:hypothetical protein